MRSFLVCVALAACSGLPSAVAVSPADVTAALAARNDPAQAAVVESMNRFAFDLYPSARGSSENATYSPASIALAGSMLEAGARGATAEQLARAFHVPPEGAAYHAAVGALVARTPLADSQDPPVLRLANRLFAQKSFPLRDAFTLVTSRDYRAPIETLDFIKEPEPARAEINAWVDRTTNHKIRELLPPGAVDVDTRLALVNAIYFMGRWQWPFDITHPEPFHRMDGAGAPVPTMRYEGSRSLPYAAFHGGQIVELPYRGTSIAMDIVLPDGTRGLLDVERDPRTAYRALFALRRRVVDVHLPKFRVESSLDLKEALRALGVRDAFDPARADLSGIAGAPHDLVVSAALHRAFVRVDERGTEAAAATAVIGELCAAVQIVRPKPLPFVVDHPFMFFLRDTATGLVLFVGRVANPG